MKNTKKKLGISFALLFGALVNLFAGEGIVVDKYVRQRVGEIEFIDVILDTDGGKLLLA